MRKNFQIAPCHQISTVMNLPHGFESTLQNHFHSTKRASASRKLTVNLVHKKEAIYQLYVGMFSGYKLISNEQIDTCSVVR